MDASATQGGGEHGGRLFGQERERLIESDMVYQALEEGLVARDQASRDACLRVGVEPRDRRQILTCVEGVEGRHRRLLESLTVETHKALMASTQRSARREGEQMIEHPGVAEARPTHIGQIEHLPTHDPGGRLRPPAVALPRTT